MPSVGQPRSPIFDNPLAPKTQTRQAPVQTSVPPASQNRAKSTETPVDLLAQLTKDTFVRSGQPTQLSKAVDGLKGLVSQGGAGLNTPELQKRVGDASEALQALTGLAKALEPVSLDSITQRIDRLETSLTRTKSDISAQQALVAEIEAKGGDSRGPQLQLELLKKVGEIQGLVRDNLTELADVLTFKQAANGLESLAKAVGEQNRTIVSNIPLGVAPASSNPGDSIIERLPALVGPVLGQQVVLLNDPAPGSPNQDGAVQPQAAAGVALKNAITALEKKIQSTDKPVQKVQLQQILELTQKIQAGNTLQNQLAGFANLAKELGLPPEQTQKAGKILEAFYQIQEATRRLPPGQLLPILLAKAQDEKAGIPSPPGSRLPLELQRTLIGLEGDLAELDQTVNQLFSTLDDDSRKNLRQFITAIRNAGQEILPSGDQLKAQIREQLIKLSEEPPEEQKKILDQLGNADPEVNNFLLEARGLSPQARQLLESLPGPIQATGGRPAREKLSAAQCRRSRQVRLRKH